MLEKILDHIHNYFIKEVHSGDFRIVSGKLDVDFLLDGQYFKVVGSALNDGVYKYDDQLSMNDENFNGEVWAMAVPRAVIALALEIEEWVGKFGAAASSPFQSESFGGYSYTKGNAGRSADGGYGSGSWEDVFRSQLNAYRKIA